MADQARLKAVLSAIKNVSPIKITTLSVVQIRYSSSEFILSFLQVKDEKKFACAERTLLDDFPPSLNPGICCRMEADS
jgi:hypothetical protein